MIEEELDFFVAFWSDEDSFTVFDVLDLAFAIDFFFIFEAADFLGLDVLDLVFGLSLTAIFFFVEALDFGLDFDFETALVGERFLLD
ncbi:MAG: hypothetical protein NPIRA01_17950 [Nitrospirales bacterium]|nr:MAG: hypothetical protein NPIRA01_17950 [Nitrospirales bacterium]